MSAEVDVDAEAGADVEAWTDEFEVAADEDEIDDCEADLKEAFPPPPPPQPTIITINKGTAIK